MSAITELFYQTNRIETTNNFQLSITVVGFLLQKKEKGDDYMNKPIIDIPRASENTIRALVNAGILVVTENGIKIAK